MTKVAIVGHGVVGQAYSRVFFDALIYDPVRYDREERPFSYRRGILTDSHDEVNACDLAIVCVPTNPLPDGTLDMSIVKEVVGWLQTPVILIKSTLNPGTTDILNALKGRRLVASPEYVGSARHYVPPQFPDPRNPISHGFMILGGDPADCDYVADIFTPVVGPSCRFRFVSALEAELIKLAENAFLGLKVSFATELRRIAEAHGASWQQVRQGWLDDPRVGVSHSESFKQAPGFGSSHCLTKDIPALVAASRAAGYEPRLLAGMIEANEGLRAKA